MKINESDTDSYGNYKKQLENDNLHQNRLKHVLIENDSDNVKQNINKNEFLKDSYMSRWSVSSTHFKK